MKTHRSLSVVQYGVRFLRALSARHAMLSSAALMLLCGQPAPGQNTAYVNINAPPGGTGLSWATAYNSLHDALAGQGFDEIWVARGLYLPDTIDRTISFELRDGVEVYGGFVGNETLREQRDWMANETILSGDLFQNDGPNFFNTFDNSFHVVSAAGVGGSTILDGFSIVGGYAESGATTPANGAGVFAPSGHPAVRNCRFIDNQAAKGAGVYASGAGVMVIEDCYFEHNESHSGGGGVHIDAGLTGRLNRCGFDDNFGNMGGAVGVEGGSVTITDSTIANGRSWQRGGGVGGYGALVQIDGCTFTANEGIQGGAIGVRSCSLTVRNSQFGDNAAIGSIGIGGGIDLYESTGVITDCVFIRNTSWQGGAIRANFSDLSIADCRLEYNSATDEGGGVQLQNGSIEAVRCRFVGNTGSPGGALSLSLINESPQSPHLLECILEANHSDRTGGAVNVRYSLLAVMQCRFAGNTSSRGGGAINGPGEFVNCVFVGNRTSDDYGGAIRAGDRLAISQCTIVGNESRTSGGGVYYLGGGLLSVVNSVLWDNVALGVGTRLAQLDVASIPSSLTVSYDCVQGGTAVGGGVGVISLDPMFVDGRGPDLIYGTSDDDLHVLSYSPCRDSGANALTPNDVYDLDGDGDRLEPLPFDLEGSGRFIEDYWMPPAGAGLPPLVDLGAYEAQPSICTPDFDPNGVLDVFDFLAFQNFFVLGDPRADLDHSTGVGVFDVFDFLVFQTLFTRGCGP